VHIFKFRMVNGACLTMAINGWLFLTQIYYIPTFYQLAYGYSAIRAGALLLPLTLVQSMLLAGFLFPLFQSPFPLFYYLGSIGCPLR
jgi:hypothetical protein